VFHVLQCAKGHENSGEVGTMVYKKLFTLSEMIDQAKIDAKLNDGVLRLTLPKVVKSAPRRITVKTG
jgi:HSP20 family protein